MKDYIDKLREDYHRKQIKKLKFGDKFMAKINDIRYGKISAPEQEVDENGEPVSKGPSPSLTALKGPNAPLGKDGKPSLFTNSQMGLGNQDKDVIYSPDYEKKGKELEKSQEDLKNTLTNPGQESTYDGKKAPSFIKEGEKTQEKPKEQQQSEGFFLPPNGDLTTNLYNLGRAIGQKKGTPGRGFGIVGNAGAATLEATRSLLSGVGFSKAQAYTDQFNQEQMIAARKKYESNPQYSNANYTGGPTESRLGGRINHFAEGGEQQMDPRAQQMMAQQQQQQADPRMQQQQMDPRMAQQQQMDPRMQQQQEGQMNEKEAQAYQQIAEKLVNSFETIEEIAEYLKENRVDEIAYKAILQFAEGMMEDRDQSADDNEEATEEPQGAEDTEGSEEGQMRKGGKKFNKKVGEYIEFEYDGKTYKGTIKSIKNGQIFLK